MKREVNNGIAVYLISLLIMPILTMIGLLLLQEQMLNEVEILNLPISTISNTFKGEIILFLVAWVGLFVSYLFHLFGIKIAQFVLMLASFVFLIVSVCTALNTYASISHILNPIVLFMSAGYGLLKPLDQDVVDRRKKRVKNVVSKTTKKMETKVVNKDSKKDTKKNSKGK